MCRTNVFKKKCYAEKDLLRIALGEILITLLKNFDEWTSLISRGISFQIFTAANQFAPYSLDYCADLDH